MLFEIIRVGNDNTLPQPREVLEFPSVTQAEGYCRDHSWREETFLITRIIREVPKVT